MYLLDVAPFIQQGRTFVPVRFLGNALGIPDKNIDWEEGEQKVTMQRGELVLELWVDSKNREKNDVQDIMDVAPQLTEGRTQLPARFVAEGLGFDVKWDAERQVVIVWEIGAPMPEITLVPGLEQVVEQPVPVVEGDTIKIDGWVVPTGLKTFQDGINVNYFTDPGRAAFAIRIYLRSISLEQDIVQVRGILAQKFSTSQVDQIMDRLEYALITRKSVNGLKSETVMFNNIKVDSGNMGNRGVSITVWREGQF